MCDDGGGSRATTTEAGGGEDDARTGLGDADGDGASLAAEAGFGAEVAGSEFRAEVAPKDESVGMADELECESMQRRAKEFWRFGGQASEDRQRGGARIRTFGALEAMAPRGASEQGGKAKMSGRKADEVMYDWNGGAEGALPDVDRPGPVVATARAEMRDMMDFEAALPVGGARPTSEGDTGGGGGADSVADGVAGGGMPTAYKRGPAGRRDRTWPRAEPMMSRRTPGRAVTDSDLLGAPEGSLALPWMWG